MGQLKNSTAMFDASGIWEFAVFVNVWHTSPIGTVELVWRDEVTAQKPVTRERQVAYRLPYQVKKQRVKQVKRYHSGRRCAVSSRNRLPCLKRGGKPAVFSGVLRAPDSFLISSYPLPCAPFCA